MPRKIASSAKSVSINNKAHKAPKDEDVDDGYDYDEEQEIETTENNNRNNNTKNQQKSGGVRSGSTSSKSSASSSTSSASSSDDEKEFDPDALKVLRRFGSVQSVNNLTALVPENHQLETKTNNNKKSAFSASSPSPKSDHNHLTPTYTATPASVPRSTTTSSGNNNQNGMTANNTGSSDMLSSQQGKLSTSNNKTSSMNNNNQPGTSEFPSSTEIYDSSEDVTGNKTGEIFLDEEEEEEEEEDDEVSAADSEQQQQEEEDDPFHQLRGHRPAGVLFVPRAPRNEKQLGRLTKAPYKGASRLKGPKWTFLWHCLPCRYGDECVFKKKQMFCKRAHVQEELRCPQYALYGICKAGDKCKLKHSLGTMDEARRLFDVQRQKQIEEETRKLIEIRQLQQQQSNEKNEEESDENADNSNTNNEKKPSPTLVPQNQTILDALPTLSMTVREQRDRLWKTQMCVRGDQCRAFRLNFWCHDAHDPKELRCKSFALFGVCLDAERGCPLVHSNRTEKQELQRIRSQIENSRFLTGDYDDDDQEDDQHLKVPNAKNNNSNNKNNLVSPKTLPKQNNKSEHSSENGDDDDDDDDSDSSSTSSAISDDGQASSTAAAAEDKKNKSNTSTPTNKPNSNNNNGEGGNRHGHGNRHHHHGGGGGGGGSKTKFGFKLGNAGGVPDRLKHASEVGEYDDLDDMIRRSERGFGGMNHNHNNPSADSANSSGNSNNYHKVGRRGNKLRGGERNPNVDPSGDDDDLNNSMNNSDRAMMVVDGNSALKTEVQIPITYKTKTGKNGSRKQSAKNSPSLQPAAASSTTTVPFEQQQQQHVDPTTSAVIISGNNNKKQQQQPYQKKPIVLSEQQQMQSSSKFLLRAERNLYKTEFCPSLHFCREYRNFAWCDDAHTLDELRCPQFALTGKCPRGDACPLRHNQETRAEAKAQCEDYRKKNLGLKATKLRPDQMRKLPNPEVLTPALAAKLSAMPEAQRRLLLSNTSFCPLGVDCRPRAQGLPCGQCHETNELLCPYQMLYGECICNSNNDESKQQQNDNSDVCTRPCTRHHVDTEFPDSPSLNNEKDASSTVSSPSENNINNNNNNNKNNEPLHHRNRTLVLGENNNSKSHENTPIATTLASPSSLLNVPFNSPNAKLNNNNNNNKNKKAPTLVRSTSHFFDSETGEALFYVDVPPSLTITGASPLVEPKSKHHHHHHHHRDEKLLQPQENNTQNVTDGSMEEQDELNNAVGEASSPKSPPFLQSTPLTANSTKQNTFTTSSTTISNNNKHHARSFSNASNTTGKNNKDNNSNNNSFTTPPDSSSASAPPLASGGGAGVNTLPLSATTNSSGPSMPNHWVDFLWKTRWCPFLANCKEYVSGSSWCFGAHEESEMRCPQFALTSVLHEKFAKEIETGEIKIDEKYGACPRGSECPFCHSSGTAKEQKAKFNRGESGNKNKNNNNDDDDDDEARRLASSSVTSSVVLEESNTSNKKSSQQQSPAADCSSTLASSDPSKFVEPAIPEALLSQYRIMKSAERRRLFFKTSLCPLLAPLCEDCVNNRCFFASSLNELRCPYFSLLGLCPRRRCEWLHCTHEALGTCRSPAVINPKSSHHMFSIKTSSSANSSPSSSTLTSPQQFDSITFRVDPPEHLWPPTPQLTPQISAARRNGKNDAEEESIPDLKL